MKKTLKRGLCLVLALVLAMAMGITALAACVHEAHHQTLRQVSGYRYYSSSQCEAEYEVTWTCKNCDKTFVESKFLREAHNFRPYSSSCNGTTQTWKESCSNCGYGRSTLHKCPKAPHTGPCTVLPYSVTPETEKK